MLFSLASLNRWKCDIINTVYSNIHVYGSYLTHRNYPVCSCELARATEHKLNNSLLRHVVSHDSSSWAVAIAAVCGSVIHQLTLFCCESIQNTLGVLCRRTPHLHTRTSSPSRRSPGPQTTFSGFTLDSGAGGSHVKTSPGSKTSPIFSLKLFIITTGCRYTSILTDVCHKLSTLRGETKLCNTLK